MSRNIALLLFIFSILLFSVNASSMNITLTSSIYGNNSLFNGYLNFNVSGNYTFDQTFVANTNGNSYSITIKDWLNNSNIAYSILPSVYDIFGDPFSASQILGNSGSKIIGFKIPKNTNIANITLNISGFGDLTVDVGNDNVPDWQYTGSQINWNQETYPLGYDNNSRNDLESSPLYGGSTPLKRCENINLTFNTLIPSSKLRVYVQAKKLASGADLNVSLSGMSSECRVSDDSMNPDSYIKSYCDFSIDNPQNKNYQICVYAKGGNGNTIYYKIPKLSDYYFITASSANYNTTISSNAAIQSQAINNKARYLINICTTSSCIIPFKFTLNGDGQINLDNILLQDISKNEFTAMYNVIYTTQKISMNSLVKFPLSGFYELITPISQNNYSLKISFNNIDSNSASYSVGNAPNPVITASTTITSYNQTISFSAQGSTSPNGNIKSYFWDFGDGTNATGISVSHKFSSFGTYTVVLSLDDNLGIKSSKSLTIYIRSQEAELSSLIDDTDSLLYESNTNYNKGSSELRQTYQDLGYSNSINQAQNNLSSIKSKYNSILINESIENKEELFKSLIDQINIIRSTTPLVLQVDIAQYSDLLPELADIPNPSSLNKVVSNIDSFKEEVVLFNQENIKINADIRKIQVIFIEGNDSFMLIKKSISSSVSGIKVIENFPSSIEEIQVIYPNNYNKSSSYNFIDFGFTRELLYKSKTLSGTTVVIPSNISIQKTSVCGDGICNSDETKTSCQVDCQKKFPWGFYIPLFIIVLLGVIYINFYKGPGNFRDLSNKISVRFRKKRLFTNKEDVDKLTEYVSGVSRRGYTEQQIRSALLKKGWTNEQIDSAFRNSSKIKRIK